jgi:hypothetical protein
MEMQEVGWLCAGLIGVEGRGRSPLDRLTAARVCPRTGVFRTGWVCYDTYIMGPIRGVYLYGLDQGRGLYHESRNPGLFSCPQPREVAVSRPARERGRSINFYSPSCLEKLFGKSEWASLWVPQGAKTG